MELFLKKGKWGGTHGTLGMFVETQTVQSGRQIGMAAVYVYQMLVVIR
jgi:hypothetical protein